MLLNVFHHKDINYIATEIEEKSEIMQDKECSSICCSD